MEKITKIILSALFLLCLANMPYGYYQFIRFVAFIGFSILAYFAYQQKREVEIIVYAALAILFQPLFKIALGRELWNVIDVVVTIGLIISLFIKPQKEEI